MDYKKCRFDAEDCPLEECRLNELEKRLQKAEEILKWYADEYNYEYFGKTDIDLHEITDIDEDYGQKARDYFQE